MTGKILIGAAALALSACSVEMPLLDKPAMAPAPVAPAATAPARHPDIAGATPAKMARAAAATCIDSADDLPAAAAQFRGAGWTGDDAALVRPVEGGGFITVSLDPAARSCRVASEAISIYEARAIARDLARKMYPTAWEGLSGSCAGYRFTDPRGTIELNYGGAAPASPCPDATGASLILRGPLG